jgi:hypothetical protein
LGQGFGTEAKGGGQQQVRLLPKPKNMENKLKNALKWITGILEELNIPYQISGGFAAHIYGAARPVNDIDIDVPEDRMEEIVPRVKDFIIQELGHFQDKKWDAKLMVLDYHGQIIDLDGAENMKIYDEVNNIWVPCPANLKSSRILKVFGLDIPVVNPRDLADYKKLLIAEGHEHHVGDVEAVEKYLSIN